MKIKRTVFLEGQYYSFEQEHSWQPIVGEGWYSVWSEALVCPQCLRVWAMLTIEGATHHAVKQACCQRCKPREAHWLNAYPPGSLLVERGLGVIETPLLEALPDGLLKREFDLHLAYYAREIQREETSREGKATDGSG